MNANRIVIIGSGSDLVQPLIKDAPQHGLEVLKLSRSDWDLSNSRPSTELIDKIVRFDPQHLLYAAGHNELIDITADPPFVISQIQTHLSINCLSFISATLFLVKELQVPLRSIHAISSLYGVYGRRSRIPYSVSKHALEGAIKCLAIEFPQTQVLGYRPGFFDTRLTRQNVTKSSRQALQARIPLKRFGQADELSTCILANILHPSPYYTGHCITVDGAMTAGGVFDQ